MISLPQSQLHKAALNAYSGEEVVIGLDDPAAPATVTDPSDTAFKVVLMPIRF